IRMDHWSQGRVVLVGDAGYCASPMSGQGASLALIGAHVLAGESFLDGFRVLDLGSKKYGLVEGNADDGHEVTRQATDGVRSRGSGSQRTLCSREMDSNHWFPVAIGQVRTPEWRSLRRNTGLIRFGRGTQRRPVARNRWFESISLQRRVRCEPDFRGRSP